MLTPLFISVLALVFSVASFWWIHARTGRLRLSSVPVFAGVWTVRDGAPEITLRVPICLYNTGARARTVEGLRLYTPYWSGEARLEWASLAEAIDPGRGNELDRDFVAPYAIDPRRADTRFVDFRYAVPGALPEAEPTVFILQALLDGRDRWEEVGRLTLHLGHMSHPESFIAYRNDPTLCQGETNERTTAAWGRHLGRAKSPAEAQRGE